jgi:hypothetical protein
MTSVVTSATDVVYMDVLFRPKATAKAGDDHKEDKGGKDQGGSCRDMPCCAYCRQDKVKAGGATCHEDGWWYCEDCWRMWRRYVYDQEKKGWLVIMQGLHWVKRGLDGEVYTDQEADDYDYDVCLDGDVYMDDEPDWAAEKENYYSMYLWS